MEGKSLLISSRIEGLEIVQNSGFRRVQEGRKIAIFVKIAVLEGFWRVFLGLFNITTHEFRGFGGSKMAKFINKSR